MLPTNLSTDSLFESYLRQLHKNKVGVFYPALFVYGYLHALGDNELLTGRIMRFREQFNLQKPVTTDSILSIWYKLNN